MAVLTEKTTNNKQQHLFENNFAYITEGGDIILKETSLFKERKIATVEPDAAEEQVEKYTAAFDELKESVDSFFVEAGKTAGEEAGKLKEEYDGLVTKVKSADAVGDFEDLISSAQQKFDDLLKSAQAEKAEDDKEPAAEIETAATTEETTETDETDQPTAVETESKKTEAEEAETAPAEETEKKAGSEDAKDPEEKTATEDVESEEADDSPEAYYKKLAEKAETLSELKDWSYATMEFDNLNLKWGEGPDPEGADIKPYRQKIDTLREELEEKKRAHYEEQQRIRQENLEKKKDLLKQLKAIIDEKKWTLTRDVSKIKNKWEQIKPIPASEQDKLESSFNSYLTVFDDHKVDRLVKQKQQEEDNLTGKLVILEKMEAFLSSVDDKADWNELDKKMSEFARQFRKIGRIPAEKNQEVWDRFHTAQDQFHSLRFKHDKKYRKNIEKFLSKKKKLIDEAEALVDADDLAEAARKVNKLHRRWKKTGNLPQKDENELWDRFKAATDAFNDKKSENIDQLREQEEQNYEEKLKLIDQAEALKDSEEWEKTHKAYQKLMDRWKAAGPVPRRKSGKIWKKFKGAMDHFYNRRRDFFKEVKSERKDNLKEKEDILDKLKELQSHDNPIEAVELAKPLQEEFKKAGYVPIQHKNRMWKEYRETCDVIYDRFRAAKSAAQIVGKENVENFSADDLTAIKKKQEQADKLRKEINTLSNELIQMKESLSYFKPSGKGSSLLDDVKARIDKAEDTINQKEEKLQSLEVEIDKIKRSS